ncbi:hypothetical protein VTJ49DRAFT_4721 [Mycothermus thermophilus]|uniref:T6SS Phospholipase effector Tle1-like catalytic domain-containing protein n=1 Tax=Humicola insolens TaxID=85995 RepID=A0ABR3V5Q2_HUMIN
MNGHAPAIESTFEAHTDHHDFLSTHLPSRPVTPMEPDQAAPSTVDAQRKPRKIVLCFDGTGNKFHGDDSDSNILKIFRMLDRTASDQFHYYQPGIGTYVVSNNLTRTSLAARIKSWYRKAKDSAVGSSFDQHVVGGYRFLMRFYDPGDEIYIFGFSRGAYIARFLAEMLDYVGLLSHGNEEMVIFAWKAFASWQSRQGSKTPEGIRKKREMYTFMKGFRETFSRPVRRIRFLGLFDTVNSVPRFETAWMERSKFPYTARASAKVIRHAVSIDERRAKFRQDLIYQSPRRKANGGKKSKKRATNNISPEKQDLDHDHDHDEGQRYRRRSSLALPHDSRSTRSRRLTLQVPRDEAPYRTRSRSRPASIRSRRTTSTREEDVRSIRSAAPHPHDEDASIASAAESEDETDQDIDEVWFAGGHADIGGGWELEPDEAKPASHVPLVWMVQEAMRAGLKFDLDKVREMGCAEALWELEREREGEGGEEGGTSSAAAAAVADEAPPIPEIMVRSETMSSPMMLGTGPSSSSSSGSERQPTFREMMHKAHTARIHDSLEFGGGLPATSVLAWKIMEYLPFRRMDLQPDSSWKPIRWPLPRGEVRDMPRDARIHGSVLRRLRSDPKYRPGNLIVGGGGRGVRVAPPEAEIGEWVCVENEGCPLKS